MLLGTAVAASGATPVAPTPRYGISNTLYVASAVLDAFERRATESDYDRWAGDLDQGGTRGEFATDLFRRREWSEAVVRETYDQVLFRTPDPGGLTYWTNKLQAGFRSADLAVALYASNEYYSGAGGTPKAYVTVTYLSILHRPADPAGQAFWQRRLEAGQPRSVIARNFWLATESNGRRVDGLYARFLRREPDPVSRLAWSKRLIKEDDKVLAAALVASEEYFEWSQRREDL